MSEVSKSTQIVKFPKGHYIITEKSKKRSLFIVKSGEVGVYKESVRQELFPLGLVGPGEYLGENSLLFNAPHSASAIALTDVECIEIPYHLIEEQLEKVPSWLIALTRGVIQRLNKANDLVKRNGLVDDSLKELLERLS
jgi:CRP-like cAMP-binding protein